MLGLDTRGHSGIEVGWTGGTVRPNSCIYNLRLEYRVGTETDFQPVMNENNQPVEYARNSEAGHSAQIGPVRLPEEADDRSYVQLRWRYYFTGEREDDEDGSRSQLRVSDIEVTGSPIVSVRGGDDTTLPERVTLEQNYPNPFNNTTVVTYRLPESAYVRLDIYSVLGQKVKKYEQGLRPAGTHRIHIDADNLVSGVYIARLSVKGESVQSTETRPIRMVLVR